MDTVATAPLISLQDLSKIYVSGDTEIHALDQVTLAIQAGEFVAIMGQSGSGKSTLMNIIGCLDRPSSGRYRVRGVDVATLDVDALARLRRDTFGFVFQRYNLLPGATAAENVELPAIYAGASKTERARRAQALLTQLGLGDRSHHRPNELSGGQQQRVSIARALVNGAEVILADEPTGALDSQTGAEVIALLQRLHGEGRTIILITHDAETAAHAGRIIHIRDGRVTGDDLVAPDMADKPVPHREGHEPHGATQLAEAVKMAWRSLRGDLFRSGLTLLGVVIGVAAVVTMLGVGNGSKADVLEQIQSMGSNLLLVRPGAPGQRGGGTVATLVVADAEALRSLPNVEFVSPQRRTTGTIRAGSVDYRSQITGVWPEYQNTQDWRIATGSFITADDLRTYAAVVVLGKTAADNLFPGGENPVGHFVLITNVPFEVIGVLAPKGANAFGNDMDDVALVPLTTGFIRLFGQQHLDSLNVKIESADESDVTEADITEMLVARHGTEDFQVRSTTAMLETVETTQNTLTVLLGAVAAISLLVGGIGVMNIMLVNVTERTREIGVRMATGARPSNILLQFNTEAMVLCGVGGIIGVALGFLTGWIVDTLGTRVEFTLAPPLLAFTSAFATGLLFGYLPARKAARMDPVVALASE